MINHKKNTNIKVEFKTSRVKGFIFSPIYSSAMFMKCPSLFLTKSILGHTKDTFLKIIVLLYPQLVLDILSRLKVMFG